MRVFIVGPACILDQLRVFCMYAPYLKELYVQPEACLLSARCPHPPHRKNRTQSLLSQERGVGLR